MFRLTESDLNRRKEYLRGSFPLLYDVELRQILYSVFWPVGRSSFFLLLALLLLPAVLLAQSLAVVPNALDLGVVGVGVEARASVSVENLQDDALEVIVGISGVGFGAVADTLRLDGKSVSSVEVRFSAAAAGEYAGELTLQVAALFKGQRLVVPLQAVAVVPTLALLPAEGLDFGAVPVGQVATATVIVKNTGTVPVAVGRMAVAEPQAPFSVAGDAGLWPAPGGETRIDVAFAPTREGRSLLNSWSLRPTLGIGLFPCGGTGWFRKRPFRPSRKWASTLAPSKWVSA